MFEFGRLHKLLINPRHNNLTIASQKYPNKTHTCSDCLLEVDLDSIYEIVDNKNEDHSAAVDCMNHG